MKRIRNLLWKRMSRTLLMVGLATTAVFLWGCGAYIADTSVSGGVAYASDDVQYLAQYGDWINVAPYGMVWQPSVMAGWEPFHYGHWDWTEDGWAWVSYEPYGWIVYHYGYWDYQPGIGWFWISGNQWSPARVDWITYGDYIGWAPLPPPGVTWPEPWRHYDVGVWNVVRVKDFDRDNVGRYRIVKPPRVGEVRGELMQHQPPNIRRVEMETRRKIPRVPIERRSMNNMTFRQPERRRNEGEMHQGENQRQGQERQRPESYGQEGGQNSRSRGEQRQPEGQGSAGEMNRGQREEHRQEQGRMANRHERTPDREPRRLVLPQSEQKRVERHRAQVERDVLQHRPENRGREQDFGGGRDRGGDHDRGDGHRR